jgi:hypothetical protein
MIRQPRLQQGRVPATTIGLKGAHCSEALNPVISVASFTGNVAPQPSLLHASQTGNGVPSRLEQKRNFQQFGLAQHIAACQLAVA